MASSSTPRIFSLKADGAITAYTFVKAGSDANHCAQAGLNDRPIGIAQNAASAAGDKVEVAFPGGGAKLQVDGTVAASARLYSDASGLGKKCDGASKFIGALAMDAGVANDVIPVEVCVAQESVATD